MADEYISREAAFVTLTACYHHTTDIQHRMLRWVLGKVPAADVAEVVRCKDCKHWEYDVIFADGWCRGKHQGNPNWFCADGEMEEDKE